LKRLGLAEHVRRNLEEAGSRLCNMYVAILKRLGLAEHVSDNLEEAWLSGTCEWQY
jgi:hypothetical protein